MTNGGNFAVLALAFAMAGLVVVFFNAFGVATNEVQWDNMAVGFCFELIAVVLSLISLRDR